MAFSRFRPDATPAARIGLGLAAVGRPGYINLGRDGDLPADRSPQALRARAHALLDAAHAHGVRYVDAARSYGRAEEFLAAWLASRPEAARDMTVGSKWGYTYTADWRTDAAVHEIKDHSAAAFDRQWSESEHLLGGHLDLYQIHSVTPASQVLADQEVRSRLARLAAGGVTVGLSTSGPDQADAIRAALEVTVDGRPLFATVQATYNVLETSAGDALAEAHDAGLTVIVKEALANGRLAGDVAPRELHFVAEETGTTPDAVALAFVLSQPWTGLVLSGAASTGQLAANLAAARIRLDDGQQNMLTRPAQPGASYWHARADLPWH
ncbi:aldo/keto reductase [Streptomyces avicenniae]|uniref:aldo/keto reductase n=1 Tax=Streptomyces avicenniae TaxID=500153 RepID=UPI00069C722B|nr:aldo/keto reductase [Streptomyces avicenniae]